MGRHHGKFDRLSKIGCEDVSPDEQSFYEAAAEAVANQETSEG